MSKTLNEYRARAKKRGGRALYLELTPRQNRALERIQKHYSLSAAAAVKLLISQHWLAPMSAEDEHEQVEFEEFVRHHN